VRVRPSSQETVHGFRPTGFGDSWRTRMDSKDPICKQTSQEVEDKTQRPLKFYASTKFWYICANGRQYQLCLCC
jgi:hypothetical protein